MDKEPRITVDDNAPELAEQIRRLSSNPVITGLLQAVNGLIAIVDGQRRVVAINDTLLKMLDIEDPGEALGLHLGKVLDCVHADEDPAGCGTTRYCATCGAAIAMVLSLGQEKPVERICALTTKRGGQPRDIALLVRSQAITFDRKTFLLLFLQDMTLQQQRAALERTFFHDISNMLYALEGTSHLLLKEQPSRLARNLHQTAVRLHREMSIQRCLSQSGTCDYQPVRHPFKLTDILTELRSFFANHPAARGKHLVITESETDLTVTTDLSLLSRVLSNMVTNALEASDQQDTVRVWTEHSNRSVIFHVWNRQTIPEALQSRIFQRNFSTKEQAGRGIGTFSMKFLGEAILGGKVDFRSTEELGTTFRFAVTL